MCFVIRGTYLMQFGCIIKIHVWLSVFNKLELNHLYTSMFHCILMMYWLLWIGITCPLQCCE